VEKFGNEAVRIYALGEEGVQQIESYPPPFEQPAPDARVEAEDWWFVMRASGTEGGAGAICRLYVEAVGDRALMEGKRDALVQMVGPELRV
jgi:phosphomannomutase